MYADDSVIFREGTELCKIQQEQCLTIWKM
jgi:hypothetical protein